MSSYSLKDMITESIPLNINIVERIENELDIYEIVSMAFLLYDESATFIGLQNIKLLLTSPDNPPKILSHWCQAQVSMFWKEKFIEALMIIQNYSCVRQLGLDIEELERRFSPQNFQVSHRVNLIRKALYHVIENMTEEELIKLYDYAAAELTKSVISFQPKYFEYILLQMTDVNYIDISDKPSLNNLIKIIHIIDRKELAEYLENIIKTIKSSDQDDTQSINGSIVSSSADTNDIYDRDDVYSMKQDHVGYCIIINQRQFYEEFKLDHQKDLPDKPLERRFGTDIDKERLSEVFLSFGFKIHYWEDLPHEHIIEAIQDSLENKVSKYDSCFVLCILSHGIEGHIYGVNSVPVKIKDIETLLNGKKYPKILHMPKILIIQACQGARALDVVSDDLVTDGPEDNFSPSNAPRSCHILKFYSTIPGFASFRDELRGSWFIEAIWERMLLANAGSSFLDICTLINNEVQKKRAHRQNGYKAMVSTFNSTLSKILVLPYIPEKRSKVSKLILKRYLFDHLLKEYVKRKVLNIM